MAEKAKWTEGLLVDLLNFMMDHHDDFLKAKRHQTTLQFYQRASDSIGLVMPEAGKKVEYLLKNIGKEFRKIKVQQGQSGIGTDGPNKLRDSEMLYVLYEEFQSLYYPKGSAVQPQILVTPAGVVNTSAGGTSARNKTANMGTIALGLTPEPIPGTSHAVGLTPSMSSTSITEESSRTHAVRELVFAPGGAQQSGSGKRSAEATTIPGSNEKAPKMKRNDFLSTSVDCQEQYIQIIREQNKIMQNLVNEVRLFHTAYQAVNNIQFAGEHFHISGGEQ
jgi:hypothetical protein